MTKVLVTESNLTAIANAIRGRNGSSNTYKPGQMADAVTAIPNSYAAGDEGKVVSNGALVAQTSRNVTANGTYDTTTNNEVVVSVAPNLQSKTATENGTVTPDQGYDGLSSVVVNVQGGGGIEDSINEIMGLNGTNYARLSANSSDKLLIGNDYFQRNSNEPVVFLPCINNNRNYAGYAVISFNSSFTGTYSASGNILSQGGGTTPKGHTYNKFMMPGTMTKPITDVGGIVSFYINGVTAQITILNASVYLSTNDSSTKGDQQAIAALNAYLDRIYEVYYA